MIKVAFMGPRTLTLKVGGVEYTRRMRDLLPTQGVRLGYVGTWRSYPQAAAADLDRLAALLAGQQEDAVLLVDGHYLGVMTPDLIRGFAPRIVALVHHPLSHESGLSASDREALLRSERATLALAGEVVTTSAFTARVLAEEFGVSSERLTVAEPGTTPALRARGTGKPVHIIAVGAISPRKDFGTLVAALARLERLPWRAIIVGNHNSNIEASRALRAAVAASGVSDRIEFAGEVSEAVLGALYDRADVFVSTSLYEGYGMAVTEALARGLPLIVATGGAAGETAPDQATVKFAPGDVEALAAALATVITDPDRRASLGEHAWAARRSLPRWTDTAARLAAVLKSAAARNADAREPARV